MLIPTVHLNGTSREELVQLRLDAVDNIREAITALQKATPHARDYYTQIPNTYNQARAIWQARMDLLHEVHDEIRAEALEIQDS